jgi:hypothetical protein
MRSKLTPNLSGRSRASASLFLVALAWAGCSSPSAAPVEGTVTLDGAPLAEAYITLVTYEGAETDSAEALGPFNGRTDAQGHFSLGPVDNPGGGVPVGSYRISITTAHSANAGDEGAVAPPERVPEPYRSGNVQFDVPDGGNESANFDLKSK